MEQTIQATASTVPIRLACELAQIPRCTFYRHRGGNDDGCDGEELELRDQIQRICLEQSSGGYRRVTKELHRRGYVINHKRVLALMRKDNLLSVRKKRWVSTTNGNHACPVYPNLAREIQPSAPDQLWVADITYIRLRREFIYLALILDAFSRRAIGWALERYLDTRLTAAALHMALGDRAVRPGLVHHSDRGLQYASQEYVDILETDNITISMSRPGNPYDNATVESFIKTLKYEEVYVNEYNSLTDAKNNIEHFLTVVYNQRRLHSSLGYVPPAEFEAPYLITQSRNQVSPEPVLTVSF